MRQLCTPVFLLCSESTDLVLIYALLQSDVWDNIRQGLNTRAFQTLLKGSESKVVPCLKIAHPNTHRTDLVTALGVFIRAPLSHGPSSAMAASSPAMARILMCPRQTPP